MHADLERAEEKMRSVKRERSSSLNSNSGRGEGEVMWGLNEGEEIESKEEGWEVWVEVMTRRFMEGRDPEADYHGIDGSEEWDDVKEGEREAEERYFGEEEPEEGQGTDTGVLDY